MSIRRITISVQEDVARRVKRAAGKTPVSAWVTDLIESRLDDSRLERAWREFYEDVSPTKAQAKRADAIFRRLTRRRRRAA